MMELEGFPVETCHLCSFGPPALVLRYLGRQSQEWDLLGLNAGIYFEYGLIRNDKLFLSLIPDADNVSIVGSDHRMVSMLENCYGICMSESEQTDVEALQIIRDELSIGMPVHIYVDVFHLPYHPLYRQTHALHSVLVTGLDQTGRRIRVVDYQVSTLPISCFNGYVDIEEFRNAIRYSGTNTRLFTFAVTYDRRPSLTDRIRAVRLNARRMLEPTVPGFTGVSGIRKLAEDIPRWPERWGTQLAPVLASAYSHLTSHAGAALSRTSYSCYLSDIARMLQASRWQEAAAMFDALGKRWRMLANLLFRASVKEAHEAIARAASYTADLAASEEAVFRLLDELAADCQRKEEEDDQMSHLGPGWDDVGGGCR